MTTILANNLLVEGLRNEFVDTYTEIKNKQASSLLGRVMNLSIPATNRYGIFSYLNASPHPEEWKPGESIPTDAMDSVQFTADNYVWAKRVPWSKWDRKDDQTQSLFEAARAHGESHALIPERIFFNLLLNDTTDLLPKVPLAPDGVAFFTTNTRFEASGGNSVTKAGVTTVHDIRANYYTALEQFMLFKDGKGQPLLSPEIIDGGVTIIHASSVTEAFETTFLQERQALGLDNTGAIGGTVVDAAGTSNLNLEIPTRKVTLWGTSRLTTADEWYIFLNNAPKKATALFDRQTVEEYSAIEGDNNSDSVRDTAEEYIQFESRSGGIIALPHGAIKIPT